MQQNPKNKAPVQYGTKAMADKPKERYSITNAKNVLHLVLKCVLSIALPYLYLIICGMIDQSLVSRGAITVSGRETFIVFVFFSLMLFWIVGITISVISVVKYIKKQKASVSVSNPNNMRDPAVRPRNSAVNPDNDRK